VERAINLLIVGASARAAAFSALRAGLNPCCADLFADADLQARCPAIQVSREGYPRGFAYLADKDLPGPWMYTGALENWPWLVERMARRRPLWGNRGMALGRARLPKWTARLLRKAGLPCPLARYHDVPRQGRWLTKPLFGSGGTRIGFVPDRGWPRSTGARPSFFRELLAEALPTAPRHYFQEFIEGEPYAAIYLGQGRRGRLLGVTHQIVGATWLHAGPFRYCGSIGPCTLDDQGQKAFERIGSVLTAGCHLRGLFGVDCILREGVPWPVEVNPRYTASVEVLEYGARVPAMALHRAVFDPQAPPAGPKRQAADGLVVGKAILFARAAVVFPDDGPWSATLRSPGPIEEMPEFADIPHAGERIEARRPILTCFTRAGSEAACLEQLEGIAADLDRWLFER
jgi:predicted ATP-grasp superfamily ATP-dependent carboligase